MLIKSTNSSGSSILMAIGTIAVLLILVSSLAVSYIRESKLSRFSYNEVLVSTASEWIFEYGMLKIRNHKSGFEDATFSGEVDGNILDLSTDRSKGLHTQYSISSSSTSHVFSLSGSEQLVIPLFSSTGSALLWVASKSPIYNTNVANTSNLEISGIGGLSWSIVAMSGTQNIAIAGNGDISLATTGLLRITLSQCYSAVDGSPKSCSHLDPWDDEVLYSYDETKSIADFLANKTDPYFILYNSNTPASPPILVNITSTRPFSLPTITLTANSKKWDSSQIYEFIEDKWKYYDVLKYGIYNNP